MHHINVINGIITINTAAYVFQFNAGFAVFFEMSLAELTCVVNLAIVYYIDAIVY